MPWHDTSMTLQGPVVVDLQQHFVERYVAGAPSPTRRSEPQADPIVRPPPRWNFVKHLKYKHNERYEWLALPHRTLVRSLARVSKPTS
jgi:phospholipase D1/2